MAKSFAKAFYNSREWRECRAGYIASVQGLCETCLERGIVRPGHILHHVITLTPQNINDPEVALNWEHLKFECQECHNKEHFETNEVIREGLMFDGNGDVVLSPPIK